MRATTNYRYPPAWFRQEDKQTSSVGDERPYSCNESSPLSTYSRLKGTTCHAIFSNPLFPSSEVVASSRLFSTSPLTPPRIATRGSLGVEPTATRSPSAGPATNALAKGSRHSAIHTRAMASEEILVFPFASSACVRYDIVTVCWHSVTANSETRLVGRSLCAG